MKKADLHDPRTWDFSVCPPDEIAACLYYECSRELEAEVKRVEVARSGPHRFQPSGMRYAAYHFSEFPDTPWLALDATARKMFVDKLLHPINLGYGGHPDDEPLMNPDGVWEFTKLLQEQYRDSETEEPSKVPVGIVHQEERPFSWIVMEADWTKSDRELKADFIKLLKYRPKQYRAKHSGRNNHLDLLNGLSGKRLIEWQRKKKTPNPPESTLDDWRESGAKGCPYSDPRALRASISRIKRFIAREFPAVR